MSLFIPLLIIIFAIFVISISVQFARRFGGDAVNLFQYLKGMDDKEKQQALKKSITVVGSVSFIVVLIIAVLVLFHSYSVFYDLWKNNLPDFVPDNPAFLELPVFSDEAEAYFEHGVECTPKLISSRLVDAQFFFKNNNGLYDIYHEIIDMRRGVRLAGFLEETYFENAKEYTAPMKMIQANVVVLDEKPAFVVYREEKVNHKYWITKQKDSVRLDKDYWLVNSNNDPIEIPYEIMHLVDIKDVHKNYVKVVGNGLEQYQITKSGVSKTAYWQYPLGPSAKKFSLLGYKKKSLASGFCMALSAMNREWVFFDSRSEEPIINSFKHDDLVVLLPNKLRTQFNQVLTRFPDSVMASIDSCGNILIGYNDVNAPLFEINSQLLEDGYVENVFHFLGEYENNLALHSIFDDNRKLIFVRRPEHKPREIVRMSREWKLQNYYLNERTEDGGLGEMKALDLSTLEKATKSEPVLMFPQEFDGQFYVYADQAFWTMKLDGTGLKQAFPKVSDVE